VSTPKAGVQILPLQEDQIGPLAQLYQAATADYGVYFKPFSFDEETLGRILRERRNDLYFTVLCDGELAGLYMLRGFDQGYTVPSYGVWIAQAYSRRGLARATLEHAVATCRAHGCREMMLKVHPLNTRAKLLYERFGFTQTGVDTKNNNLVYKLSLFGGKKVC
jgi:ribosomal-protein-alanine N-acetyltransferase